MIIDCVNHLVVSGFLDRDPYVRFRDDGTCVSNGTLRIEERGADGATYKVFVQCEAYARNGETLGEYHAQDLVLLQGKLFWRKYHTKTGEEKSGLALLVQKSSLLVAAAVTVEAPHGA